jgi:hypothetical protein
MVFRDYRPPVTRMTSGNSIREYDIFFSIVGPAKYPISFSKYIGPFNICLRKSCAKCLQKLKKFPGILGI